MQRYFGATARICTARSSCEVLTWSGLSFETMFRWLVQRTISAEVRSRTRWTISSYLSIGP